jgi:hypothetical protein
MKNLTIDSKEALRLYPNASSEMKAIFESTFGRDFFFGKITDKIKTYGDVIDLSGLILGLPYRPDTKTKEEKSINAYVKLLVIVKAYNEGWMPNWEDKNEYKYYPYFYRSDGSWLVYCRAWHSTLHFPSGLCFKSRKLAEDAMEKFSDTYNDYFMI